MSRPGHYDRSPESRRYFRERKRRLYREAVESLGGKCTECGVTADLEIDHVDQTQKLYRITDVLTMRREVREAELAKCQLLCLAHHIEKGEHGRPIGTCPF